jgi:thiamine pyrophosphokinase
MNPPIVHTDRGVTLVGGGPVAARDLRLALVRAPVAVAADGGAARLLAAGQMPQAVIGDFDSLPAARRAAIPPERLHPLPDQATTDFDKALRSIVAPFVLALGFAGARMDHGLAVMNALVRHAARPCLVVGPKDLAFAAPPRIALDMAPGEVLSLFPLARVAGTSTGLEWPIAGLAFAPDGFIGTSNRVTARRVSLQFDAPGMIVILPRRRLDAAIRGLQEARPVGPDAPPSRGG